MAVGECICRRHAVSDDCPKHGQVVEFRRIWGRNTSSVFDDPEWQKADQERWDRRRGQENAR